MFMIMIAIFLFSYIIYTGTWEPHHHETGHRRFSNNNLHRKPWATKSNWIGFSEWKEDGLKKKKWRTNCYMNICKEARRRSAFIFDSIDQLIISRLGDHLCEPTVKHGFVNVCGPYKTTNNRWKTHAASQQIRSNVYIQIYNINMDRKAWTITQEISCIAFRTPYTCMHYIYDQYRKIKN